MASSLSERLASWKECARTGKPAWLAELAPGIIAQLEAEVQRADPPSQENKDE